MNKKRIALALSVLLMLPLASSCGGKDQSGTESSATGRPSDWHNQIEYDGSFYVSEDKKLLYSLDKGSITLWDDGGKGEALQKITYDTTVDDAIENLVREDINGDGYVDLQTVFNKTETEASYNLWLWDAAAGRYSACGSYRLIKNPQPDPATGTVSSVQETKAFGTVRSTYRFTDALELENVSKVLDGADEFAAKIAHTFITGDVAVNPSSGEAVINEEMCAAYTVRAGTMDAAYIAYTPDATWYADVNCLGLYRVVEWNDGVYTLGYYVEEAGVAQDLALSYAQKNADITIIAKENGTFGGSSAVQYTMEVDGALLCRLCKLESGGWYISTDGSTYSDFTKGELGDTSENTFSK